MKDTDHTSSIVLILLGIWVAFNWESLLWAVVGAVFLLPLFVAWVWWTARKSK